MKKPSRQRVIDIIKQDRPLGRAKYLEAVQLRDGTVIVVYLNYSTGDTTVGGKSLVCKRLVVSTPTEVRASLIVESWWE